MTAHQSHHSFTRFLSHKFAHWFVHKVRDLGPGGVVGAVGGIVLIVLGLIGLLTRPFEGQFVVELVLGCIIFQQTLKKSFSH